MCYVLNVGDHSDQFNLDQELALIASGGIMTKKENIENIDGLLSPQFEDS